VTTWEETWTTGHRGEQDVVTTADGEWVARFSPAPGVDPDYEAARARLAAAAPDMARELLDVEWCGMANIDIEYDLPACPSCNGIDPSGSDSQIKKAESELFTVGHKTDCALDAALRKAGVRT